MSGHRPFSELAHKVMADPARAAEVERYRREIERRYDRPWWRLVRAYDRLRGRHRLS